MGKEVVLEATVEEVIRGDLYMRAVEGGKVMRMYWGGKPGS